MRVIIVFVGCRTQNLSYGRIYGVTVNIHILNPGTARPWSLRHLWPHGLLALIVYYMLWIYSWLYSIFFAMSDYKSDVSEFGNIPGILLYQFEPIRFDLPELWLK